ncbi:MAG: hypothetical protein WBA38_11860 [Gordonia sp. (in: high G+C Gram-positive bacteria)]
MSKNPPVRTKDAFSIDSTPWTAVAVCRMPGCSWRGSGHSRASVYRLLASHLTHTHAEHQRAAECRVRARRGRDISETLMPIATVDA